MPNWNMGWNGKMLARSRSPSLPRWHIQSAGQNENKPESASQPGRIRATLQAPPISRGEHKPLTLYSAQLYNFLLSWPRSPRTQIRHEFDIRSKKLLQKTSSEMARLCAFYTLANLLKTAAWFLMVGKKKKTVTCLDKRVLLYYCFYLLLQQ